MAPPLLATVDNNKDVGFLGSPSLISSDQDSVATVVEVDGVNNGGDGGGGGDGKTKKRLITTSILTVSERTKVGILFIYARRNANMTIMNE